MEIQIAEDDSAIQAAFAVMNELRPHLAKEDFLPRVRRQMQQGYLLACLKEGGQIRACAGFRHCEYLFSGPAIYVDDLVTSEAERSRGYGKALLDWLLKRAQAQGVRVIYLDSGTHRFRAHRFYFREGFFATSFHFMKDLSAAP